MNLARFGLILGGSLGAACAVVFFVRRYPRLRIDKATSQRLALLLILAWAALLGTMAALRHLAFNSTAYDLAIYDQVLWNSAQGRLFESSVLADSPIYLGHHFSPILLALVPLYWIRPDPVALVVAQAFLLAIAGLPIFWLACDLLASNALALAVLLAYLLHPATAYVALFDFHGIAFATPLLATALFLLLRGRFRLFGLALALTFLVKEEMGLVGAAIGIYVVLAQRRWLLGLALAAVGSFWTLFLVGYVIPGLHPDGKYIYGSLYTNLGATPGDVLASLLHDPRYFIGQVLTPAKLTYLGQLLAPLAGLPLLGWPILIIALPTTASVLLSDALPAELIKYQYSATLLPPLLVASTVGLTWLRERWKSRWPLVAPGLAAFMVMAALLGAYLYGPLPMARNFEAWRYQQTPRSEEARELMAQIPAEASVIAQDNLVPQLSHRRVIQLLFYADPALRPDYYFFDTNHSASRWPLPEVDDDGYARAVATVRTDAEYRLVGQRDGYLLFKREAPDLGQMAGVTFGDQITLVAYEVADRRVAAGGTLRLTTYWRAERKPDANYTLFVHMVDGSGRKWGQHDEYPTGEYLPTSEWAPGKLLRAEWSIPVARDAPPGEYRLLAGLYEFVSMKRLPVTAHQVESSGDAVTLRTVSVARTP